ncbi:hypothetical protein CWI39_2386p0010, partial [Hamiltosporidium magnivora]
CINNNINSNTPNNPNPTLTLNKCIDNNTNILISISLVKVYETFGCITSSVMTGGILNMEMIFSSENKKVIKVFNRLEFVVNRSVKVKGFNKVFVCDRIVGGVNNNVYDYKGVNDKGSVEGVSKRIDDYKGDNKKIDDYKGVSNKIDDYKGVSNRNNELEGVSNRNNELEGVSNRNNDYKGVNYNDVQQGVNNSNIYTPNEQHPFNTNNSKQHPFNTNNTISPSYNNMSYYYLLSNERESVLVEWNNTLIEVESEIRGEEETLVFKREGCYYIQISVEGICVINKDMKRIEDIRVSVKEGNIFKGVIYILSDNALYLLRIKHNMSSGGDKGCLEGVNDSVRLEGVNDTSVVLESVSDSVRLEGVNDKEGLEGVNDTSVVLESVSDRDINEGVSNNYNTLHPFNNTTYNYHPFNNTTTHHPFNNTTSNYNTFTIINTFKGVNCFSITNNLLVIIKGCYLLIYNLKGYLLLYKGNISDISTVIHNTLGDDGVEGVSNKDMLEGVSYSSRLGGVNYKDSNIKGASYKDTEIKGVNNISNTLHPVNNISNNTHLNNNITTPLTILEISSVTNMSRTVILLKHYNGLLSIYEYRNNTLLKLYSFILFTINNTNTVFSICKDIIFIKGNDMLIVKINNLGVFIHKSVQVDSIVCIGSKEEGDMDVLEGVSDIDSGLEGVSDIDSGLEGVSNMSNKQQGVNNSTNNQQDLNHMSNKQQGVNNS